MGGLIPGPEFRISALEEMTVRHERLIDDLKKAGVDSDKEILELRETLDRLEQAEIQDLKNKLNELERRVERNLAMHRPIG